MKAVMIWQHGSPEVLTVCEVAVPVPQPDQVLVQNHFIGVNFVDTQHRAGGFYPVRLPLIPGIEAAGIVAAVGTEVSDFQVGDRVAYAGYMGGNSAEYTCVPHHRLVAVPMEISLQQAAACLMQGMTAYVLTHDVYRLQANETCLIHAAAGGVGLCLVQMAKRVGACVIGTVSSSAKAHLILERGATHSIVYTQQDFEQIALDLTDGEGVHVVYDGVGGAMCEKSLRVLRSRGHLVEFGQSGGKPPLFDLTQLSGITGSKNRGSLSVTWASASDYLANPTSLRQSAGFVFEQVAAGHLQIHVEQVYSLEQSALAHEALESRRTSGKLLLKVI